MGRVAAEQIFDLAGGLKPRHDQLKVECQLIERDSVGPLPSEPENAAELARISG
jgi:DNA-binding LacI/PurR family transcriptional regulator